MLTHCSCQYPTLGASRVGTPWGRCVFFHQTFRTVPKMEGFRVEPYFSDILGVDFPLHKPYKLLM